MSVLEVKIPQLPESVTEAVLLKWNKRVGDFVNIGDNLVDIETDKVVLELPATVSGVLQDVLFADGSTVTSNVIVAKIDTSVQSADNTNSTDTGTDNIETAPNVITRDDAVSSVKTSSAVMPSAKKIADENNISLDSITGTGRSGRVLKEDVLQKLQQNTSSLLEERVPMSRLRKRIAERLIDSQRENAILTTFNEVNMHSIMQLRSLYKESFEKKHGVKLGFMSFFVKSVVCALKRFPVVNASIDGDDIVYHGYFDIGIAVSSERGLVVPILRGADNLSLADIELGIAALGRKARENKLSIDDLVGGTFSITNGGVFGSMMSTPIINPPQSAILGMHAIKERVIVENGQMIIRPMMYIALSYDHRLIDGKEAVLALSTIKSMLEDPSCILLDV